MSTRTRPATQRVNTATSAALRIRKAEVATASAEAPPAFGSRGPIDVHVREESIRRRAYNLYQSRGRVDGRALDDWLAAEAEVNRETFEGSGPLD